MLNLIIGAVLGWFAHVHYGEQITEAINRIIGGQ
jgi:hypothetical protein